MIESKRQALKGSGVLWAPRTALGNAPPLPVPTGPVMEPLHPGWSKLLSGDILRLSVAEFHWQLAHLSSDCFLKSTFKQKNEIQGTLSSWLREKGNHDAEKHNSHFVMKGMLDLQNNSLPY